MLEGLFRSDCQWSLSKGWVVVLLVSVVLVLLAYRHRKQPIVPEKRLHDDCKKTGLANAKSDRPAGAWTPSSFKISSVTPVPGSLDRLLPLSYRPFKSGPQHVTMGLKSMNWDDWIELDSLYVHYQRIRAERIKQRGPRLIKTLPARHGSMASGAQAAHELLFELVEYLPLRYPDAFDVHREGTEIVAITVRATQQSFDLKDPGLDPMTTASLLVQDDMALMIEGSDGKYYLEAGAVLVPGFWRLEDKIGMSLDDIHLSGDVPHFREKLQPSLTKFFRKLDVNKPVWRNNFFIQVIDEHTIDRGLDPLQLAWSDTMGGPEDKTPSEKLFPPVVKPSVIMYRTEKQTLRRLPRTGAILFTIRTYLTPLEEIAKEPGVARRLASAFRGMSEDTLRYKNTALYGEVMLEYLDRMADEAGDVVQ